ILALLILPATAFAAEPAPDPRQILEQVREAYKELSSFREHGTVEVAPAEGSTEPARQRLFELEATPGELTVVVADDQKGGRRDLLWRSGGQFFRYASDGEQLQPVPSLAAGLTGLTSEPEGAAFIVPRLLSEADAAWPGAEPAALEKSERCGAGTCWVIAFAPKDGVVSRLWIDSRTSLIKKSELRGASRTVTVFSEVDEVDGAEVGSRMSWASPGQPDPWKDVTLGPGGDFSEEITVELTTATVRVVDPYGQPVTGLRPEDFLVLVAGREVPVASVDWVTSKAGPAPADQVAPGASPAPLDESAAAAGPAQPAPAGKLVVFFVQAHMDPSRFRGQIKLRAHTRKLLDTLGAEDRLAVLSFDSHLKLRQDVTRDREAVHRAIDQGMSFGGKPLPRPPAGDPETLAAHLDFERALAAASPEAGLAVAAQALRFLSGEKVIIYLGYGLGKMVADDVVLRSEYKDALQALGEARASVFVLDITQADFHSLEGSLEQIAYQTGGTYSKTLIFENLATQTLANAISGHYVLAFDSDTLPRGGGTLRIKLRDGKKGRILVRTPKAQGGR
ncbi:MAG TPA: hypothetical protein VEL74_03535, partial [Thermoanaerobaculia bacterium]|nr:hypothetical protein [Thermoanaerobaculia bacterium]